MERAVYNTRAWRQLPRDYCLVSELLGDLAGPCRGLIHHHHVDPADPFSRTVQVCAAHHPKIHRVLNSMKRRRRCHHNHRYPGAREACERRLNQQAA
jgi:hypothetical protein